MELAVKRNAGALPSDFYEEPSVEKTENPESRDPAEISERAEYTHVRAPEIRRNGMMILMVFSAVIGAAVGAALAFSKNADIAALELAETAEGGFAEVFLRRLALSAVFLAAEYLLGYFALGDFLVWAAPMLCGMGLGLRLTAFGEWSLLPSAILTLAAVVLGGVLSANFSQSIMRLLRGGTVYLDSSPRRSLTLGFLGFLAMAAAAAIYEGIILNL